VISFQASSIASFLEVVAEREVAQHLEEGVVPGGVADVLQVVVLAAGAHAFLRGDGPPVGARLGAGEHVLELHHAGVGEQQRRVVAGYQRARRHDLVAVLAEELEEGRANVVDAVHGSLCKCVSRKVHRATRQPAAASARRQPLAFTAGIGACPGPAGRHPGVAGWCPAAARSRVAE
jgi:hypothetical protein